MIQIRGQGITDLQCKLTKIGIAEPLLMRKIPIERVNSDKICRMPVTHGRLIAKKDEALTNPKEKIEVDPRKNGA